ncbi:hypothetical protein, partial [Nocardioides malaquae]|uniref:hypothetical protein n=1 Tax=Nocardioides malaquae TaxID=2773426 RepID=UPI001D0D4C3E
MAPIKKAAQDFSTERKERRKKKHDPNPLYFSSIHSSCLIMGCDDVTPKPSVGKTGLHTRYNISGRDYKDGVRRKHHVTKPDMTSPTISLPDSI